MIHKFSCKNFYSFKDTVVIDFSVNKNAPQTYCYSSTELGRLSKVLAIIGPNASGKTGLLRFLPFICWLNTQAFDSKLDKDIPVKPFLLGGKKNKAVELEVEFGIGGVLYSHALVLCQERIISEKLTKTDKAGIRYGTKLLYERHWNEGAQDYSLEDRHFNLPVGFRQSLRSNASVISVAARFNHPESKEIYDYWDKIESNVREFGWAEPRTMGHIFDFYSDKENSVLKMQAERILSKYDLGLSSFAVKKNTDSSAPSPFGVEIRHSIEGVDKILPSYMYESSGTLRLLSLLKHILVVLNKGGVAVIDEFEASLHPALTKELFGLFVWPETNPHSAQLLFSTHDHRILNSLDKYQIVLVEKNAKCESNATRLDDIGPRADDNFYEKYLAGAYGAIPNLK